ncbi:MAG: TonB family protein [Burkholderiales bacterium]|nr:TonB family protein [Burkholderiales bacterium]MDP2239674.1 TonB family protein [Burkholderiales bacterium]
MGSLSARKVVPLPRRGRHERHASWRGAVAGLDARVADIERRFAALDRRYASLDMSQRMQVAVLVSLMVHAVALFGITFKMPDPSKFNNLAQPLEVVLVNTKSTTKPLKADALAQHNLDGGGNTDANRRAKSPLPVTRDDKQASELSAAAKRVEQLERESRQLMTQAKAKAKIESAPAQPEPQPQSEARVLPNASDLMQRSLEIARLEAQISKDWDEYQKRPRRRFVGARTQEFRFARYIEDWRVKVERVGELNYPQAARDQKIYGTLVATVSIKADGALDKIEINRSSGHRVLDEAAQRIVRLSAPFAPFSADITKDTDILSITRTWTFTRSDQLLTE